MEPLLHLHVDPGPTVPASGALVAWLDDDPARATSDEDVGTALQALGMPAGTAVTLSLADARSMRTVAGRRLPLLAEVRWLAALPTAADLAPWQRPSHSVLVWSAAAKLALELVAAGRVVPTLAVDEAADTGSAAWRAVVAGDPRVARLGAALDPDAPLPVDARGTRLTGTAAVLALLDAVADVCARGGRTVERAPRGAPPPLPWRSAWPMALTGADPRIALPIATLGVMAAEVATWAGPLTDDGHEDADVGLMLTLVEPDDEATGGAAPWRVAFGLAAREGVERVEAAALWSGARLVVGERDLDDPLGVLVRRIAAAARLFAPLARALDDARPVGVALDLEEVASLVDDARPALEVAGVRVVVPPALKDAIDRPLRLRLRIGSGPRAPRAEGMDGLSLRELAEARLEIVVDDEAIDDDELAAIAASGSPLVRWRGRWLRVSLDEVERLRRRVARPLALGLTEALAAAASHQHHDDELGWLEVVADGDAAELVARLRDHPGPDEARTDGFVGSLRPYQARGVAWLQRMGDLGLGAVLADQMGLGKTVQAIALLASRPGELPSLVVAPTSVVATWERELARFAPDLAVVRHHGADRAAGIAAFAPGAVVITTYALLRRDASLLTATRWDVVVLDEAQQLKNPASLGARVARGLDARMRLAMTGTPVENRLAELWALIDLTNPGLLGPRRAFERRFAGPIERWHDAEAAERLSRLIAPFVLRRRKDDPDVGVDLPSRTVLEVAVPLTGEQAALYDTVVRAAFAGEGLGTSAFERRGRILALITALKQVCNHPTHHLRDGGPLRGRSGKLDRLVELLAEVLAGGEHVLVFTQYREMGELLVRHLQEELGLGEVPFLHGGLTVGQRDDLVRRFQEDDDAPPVLLVSLRAGGTGLTLTRASHVIHFDRWWNPAVEDQATDRAHRIGQDRPVTVQTLVSSGTVEERIAALLERKRGLADRVAGSSEAWLTELDDDDLRELVALSDDAEPTGPDDLGEAETVAGPGEPDDGTAPLGLARLRLIQGGAS